MNTDARIYVAGHRGLVGSAITRRLRSLGYNNLILRSSSELDLRDMGQVERFFRTERPEYVFLAAAKVGGILANSTYPAEFIRDNLAIQTNVIHYAYLNNVRKLLFLGSSCIYPKHAPQPMQEEHLMSGYLEPTNEPYAIAKIAGLKMCEFYNRQYGTDFVSVMPTNIYGIEDNFDLQTSHVLPALIRKFAEAKQNNQPTVELWGSGTPRREFLFSDDLADACVYLINQPDASNHGLINIGAGVDITIFELAQLIGEIVGYTGEIVFDSTKPDGALRKLLDVSKLTAMGWTATTLLREGIKQTYDWYCDKCKEQPGMTL
ncbi:GDP-L-fucose synthase family protein [Cohnella cellulosilytica]|uniref:GDP-L-fucose synthase n=1 Tax=Cohnella cellulosilytica TaxID=986710 RepID=A0ABW2FJE3_9BACL